MTKIATKCCYFFMYTATKNNLNLFKIVMTKFCKKGNKKIIKELENNMYIDV